MKYRIAIVGESLTPEYIERLEGLLPMKDLAVKRSGRAIIVTTPLLEDTLKVLAEEFEVTQVAVEVVQ